MDYKGFIKKRKWDILLFIMLGLLLIPSVRTPVAVFVNRLVASSPSELKATKQQKLTTYDWKLMNLDNEIINLSASKGKVVIINLWATWCPPCIAEMPSLQKLYNVYQDKVDFYFVSNEEHSTLQRFMEVKGFDFPVFSAVSYPPYQLDSDKLPTTYVIDKNKNIIIKEIGAKDWNSTDFHKKLDQLIAE